MINLGVIIEVICCVENSVYFKLLADIEGFSSKGGELTGYKGYSYEDYRRYFPASDSDSDEFLDDSLI